MASENAAQTWPAAERIHPVTSETHLSKRIGSGHTKLRVVSGRGRRVSANRETAPLRLDTRPTELSVASAAAHKRARSEEANFPRKRSYDSQSMPAGLMDIARDETLQTITTPVREARAGFEVGILDGPEATPEEPTKSFPVAMGADLLAGSGDAVSGRPS